MGQAFGCWQNELLDMFFYYLFSVGRLYPFLEKSCIIKELTGFQGPVNHIGHVAFSLHVWCSFGLGPRMSKQVLSPTIDGYLEVEMNFTVKTVLQDFWKDLLPISVPYLTTMIDLKFKCKHTLIIITIIM